MALKILDYKPGILKDRFFFQPEYGIDSKWIRFINGKVIAQKGIKLTCHLAKEDKPDNIIIPTNQQSLAEELVLLSTQTGGVYITSGNQTIVTNYNNVLNVTPDSFCILREYDLTESTVILAFISDIKSNINAVSKTPALYIIDFQNKTIQPDTGISQVSELNLSGGIHVENNYVFIYGDNGTIAWATPSNNALSFVTGTDGQKVKNATSFSNKKILYMDTVRGNESNITLLIWTTSEVIRIKDISSEAASLSFKKDVLSRSASILSSKCVVAYDGMFFWPGLDRFYVYNGIVEQMANNFNVYSFFDELSLENNDRQFVYGFKNAKYNEIWWVYKTKTGNTKAIIYNKAGNFWYDTIYFNHNMSYLSPLSAKVYSISENIGIDVENPALTSAGVYAHDVGSDIDIKALDADHPNKAIERIIYFPFISNYYFELNTDKNILLSKIIFSFKNNPASLDSPLTVRLTGIKYPMVNIHETEAHDSTIISREEKTNIGAMALNVNFQARGIGISFSSNTYFETGAIFLDLKEGNEN